MYVTVYSYDRTAILCMIVLLFLLTLSLIGGRKGVYSVVALIFTFVCIVFLFLPLIYRGVSPVWAAVLVAILTTVVTMYLLGGISSKSVTAVVGTVLGVGISGILAILFGKWTHISGYNVADIEQLTYAGTSINTLVFLYVYNYSTTQIINMYSIGIELIQGIASTMGVILTIPLVSLLSAWHLKRKEIKIFSKIFQRTGRR